MKKSDTEIYIVHVLTHVEAKKVDLIEAESRTVVTRGWRGQPGGD